MKYSLILPAFAAVSLAAVHKVTVGPGLVYTPDSVTAAKGDVVEFKFGSGHDVVLGSFDSPCKPASSSAVYSGFPNDGDVFSMTVNGTDPLWLYCSAPGHCQGGMAMVINPPSSGNTLSSYKSAAQSVDSSSAPSNVQGGVFGAVSGGSVSSSASAAASSASAAATSSGADSSSASAAATSAASSASSAASSASAAISSATSSLASAASSSASSASKSASSAASAASSSASSTATSNAASFVGADVLMMGGVLAGGLAMIL